MSESRVVMYTKGHCSFCDRAKQLLNASGISYQEITLDGADPAILEKMITSSGGRRSVPQIFINGQSIGGFDDLHALQQSGELTRLLASD